MHTNRYEYKIDKRANERAAAAGTRCGTTGDGVCGRTGESCNRNGAGGIDVSGQACHRCGNCCDTGGGTDGVF